MGVTEIDAAVVFMEEMGVVAEETSLEVKGMLPRRLEDGRLVGVTEMGVAVVFMEMGMVAEETSLEVKGMLLRRLEDG